MELPWSAHNLREAGRSCPPAGRRGAASGQFLCIKKSCPYLTRQLWRLAASPMDNRKPAGLIRASSCGLGMTIGFALMELTVDPLLSRRHRLGQRTGAEKAIRCGGVKLYGYREVST